jgi:hypothetical protein
MGDSYTVLTWIDHPEFEPWLHSHGIVLPTPRPASRYPTPREMRHVLGQIPGYQVEESFNSQGLDLYLERQDDLRWPHSTLWVHPWLGDWELPHSFSFYKGDLELNIQVLQRFTVFCGPLIFLSASVFVPILVTPETDLNQALLHAGYL